MELSIDYGGPCWNPLGQEEDDDLSAKIIASLTERVDHARAGEQNHLNLVMR